MVEIKCRIDADEGGIGNMETKIGGSIENATAELVTIIDAMLDTFYKVYKLKDKENIVEAKKDFLEFTIRAIEAQEK